MDACPEPHQDAKASHPYFPFLFLPRELRNRIYGYCTPLTARASLFIGLILSCKQIKSEYETEAARSMRWLINETRYKVSESEGANLELRIGERGITTMRELTNPFVSYTFEYTERLEDKEEEKERRWGERLVRDGTGFDVDA